MNKLKIYTDFDKVKSVNCGFVCPLVELILTNSQEINVYQIEKKPHNADVLVLPVAIEYLLQNNDKVYYDNFLKLAKSVNKKLLIFSTGDFGTTIKDDYVVTLRLGGFKSKLPPNTFIMSPFINDPINETTGFKILPYQKTPTVGFVGHSAKGIEKFAKEFLVFLKGNSNRILKKDCTDFQFFYPSSLKRFTYLKRLQNSSQIQTNFILRKKYRAGAVSEEERNKTSLEFFNNIQQNCYTFCMRGGGNFSVRFYETLAMGRIPILIDTNTKLPFENSIDWNKHILIIKENNVNSIVTSILNFHNQWNQNTFENLQISNRKLWKTYFTKETYFINLAKQLNTIL